MPDLVPGKQFLVCIAALAALYEKQSLYVCLTRKAMLEGFFGKASDIDVYTVVF